MVVSLFPLFWLTYFRNCDHSIPLPRFITPRFHVDIFLPEGGCKPSQHAREYLCVLRPTLATDSLVATHACEFGQKIGSGSLPWRLVYQRTDWCRYRRRL